MTFDEWYATQKHQLSNEQVCRVIWESAAADERAACANIANQQVMTSWNAETDSHNRCAETIRNLVLMRSNVEFRPQDEAQLRTVAPGTQGYATKEKT